MSEGHHEIRNHDADSGITRMKSALDGLARNAKRQAIGRPSF